MKERIPFTRDHALNHYYYYYMCVCACMDVDTCMIHLKSVVRTNVAGEWHGIAEETIHWSIVGIKLSVCIKIQWVRYKLRKSVLLSYIYTNTHTHIVPVMAYRIIVIM